MQDKWCCFCKIIFYKKSQFLSGNTSSTCLLHFIMHFLWKATVAQIFISILRKITFAVSLLNHPKIFFKAICPCEICNREGKRPQMLPVRLFLLILSAAFFPLLLASVLELDATRWPRLFLFHPLNKQLHVRWIFFTPCLIASSLLFSTPLGI